MVRPRHSWGWIDTWKLRVVGVKRDSLFSQLNFHHHNILMCKHHGPLNRHPALSLAFSNIQELLSEAKNVYQNSMHVENPNYKFNKISSFLWIFMRDKSRESIKQTCFLSQSNRFKNQWFKIAQTTCLEMWIKWLLNKLWIQKILKHSILKNKMIMKSLRIKTSRIVFKY